LVLRKEPIDRTFYYLSSQKLDFEVLLPDHFPPSEEEALNSSEKADVIADGHNISKNILNNASKLRLFSIKVLA